MKRVISALALISLVCLSGCIPKQYRFQNATLQQNNAKSAGVGDVFFRQETMYGEDNGFGVVYKGEAKAFDLTVVSLTDPSISLQYNEYTKLPVTQFGGFRPGDPWVIRDKFSQKYDYSLTNKAIKFKDYEFEVVGVSNGSLQYRRVR